MPWNPRKKKPSILPREEGEEIPFVLFVVVVAAALLVTSSFTWDLLMLCALGSLMAVLRETYVVPGIKPGLFEGKKNKFYPSYYLSDPKDIPIFGWGKQT